MRPLSPARCLGGLLKGRTVTPAEPLLTPGTTQSAFRDAPLVNVGRISGGLKFTTRRERPREVAFCPRWCRECMLSQHANVAFELLKSVLSAPIPPTPPPPDSYAGGVSLQHLELLWGTVRSHRAALGWGLPGTDGPVEQYVFSVGIGNGRAERSLYTGAAFSPWALQSACSATFQPCDSGKPFKP